jgi:hypothetical protein
MLAMRGHRYSLVWKTPLGAIVYCGDLHTIPAAQAGIPHPEKITAPEMSAMDVDRPKHISRCSQRQNNEDDDAISFGNVDE